MVALSRTLGVVRSTGIGVAAMVGAGVFFVWAPAFDYAGSWLMVSLLIAALVATLNALVTTQLAINVPQSGGIYAFGRHYRGPFTGFVAGWMFLTGKTASVAAIALIAGSYLWPDAPRWVAMAIVALGTLTIVSGIRLTATVSLVIATVVVTGIVGLILVATFSGTTPPASMPPADQTSPLGVLTAAGLIFFAFAGYARMATLAEEVVEPRVTLPRAIGWALGLVLTLYALTGWSVLGVLESGAAIVDTPLRVIAPEGWSVAVSSLAVIACVGSLISILAGLSRTALQMGREGDLPGLLARVSPRTGGPWVAELGVGVVAMVAVAVLDITGLVAVSGAGVLTYYAIGHWSALKLTRTERLVPPIVPVIGFVLCVALVVTLPWQSVAFATASFVVGVVWFVIAHRSGRAGSESRKL
jgi:APA family basic amino acid/polyamine antiporter